MKLVPRYLIEQIVWSNMICPRRLVIVNSTIETFTNTERFNLQLFTINLQLCVNIFKTISSGYGSQFYVPHDSCPHVSMIIDYIL